MTPRLPLEGIRVIEFSHMIMGPCCGLILADLGADVVKIEPPGGDKTRDLAGSGAGFFASFNRNKRSIALDLSRPEALDQAKALIAGADIVIENFRQGALARQGLDYETLREANPRLIHCALKGFLDGPYRHRTALDEVVQMMGGLAYMTGPRGRPLRAGASVNDILGGAFAVIGILGALREREKTGLGMKVESGLFEACAFLIAPHMMQMAMTGEAAAPMPERLSAWAIYDVFDVASGEQVFLGVVSDAQWQAFCREFGFVSYLSDPELGSNRARVRARSRFLPAIRARFREMPATILLEAAERIGLPVAPIRKPEDLFGDPHLAHPGAMLALTLPDGTATRIPALPIALDAARLPLRRDPPQRPGTDAETALTEILRDWGIELPPDAACPKVSREAGP
jgi:crotonobetainyl-CoA:carnitine CoA-transferase CaiB-like acyl-CoA transferase